MKSTLRLFRTTTLANEWASAYVAADPSATWQRHKRLVIVGKGEAIYLAAVDRILIGLHINQVILDESLAP